ncbi:uncharacterized protein LOC111123606 isoform X5 [Crassostrea virginica]
MAISVCFHFTLFVAALYISYQGASGQSHECETKAATCSTSLKISGDKEEICKSVETYFTCIENAIKQCGLGEDVLAQAREQMAPYGCSASGFPAVSALCLHMAALFHMLS